MCVPAQLTWPQLAKQLRALGDTVDAVRVALGTSGLLATFHLIAEHWRAVGAAERAWRDVVVGRASEGGFSAMVTQWRALSTTGVDRAAVAELDKVGMTAAFEVVGQLGMPKAQQASAELAIATRVQQRVAEFHKENGA